jgi:hypothetical protein
MDLQVRPSPAEGISSHPPPLPIRDVTIHTETVKIELESVDRNQKTKCQSASPPMGLVVGTVCRDEIP